MKLFIFPISAQCKQVYIMLTDSPPPSHVILSSFVEERLKICMKKEGMQSYFIDIWYAYRYFPNLMDIHDSFLSDIIHVYDCDLHGDEGEGVHGGGFVGSS